MKATGETMSIGRTMEESLLKAIRSLEDGKNHIHLEKFDVKNLSRKKAPENRTEAIDKLLHYIEEGTDDRIYAISELLWLGADPQIIYARTKIDMFFLDKMKKLEAYADACEAAGRYVLANENADTVNEPVEYSRIYELIYDAKRMGFSDSYIAELLRCNEEDIRLFRKRHAIRPVYKMIDTCASEFASYVPYFYSTYEDENESIISDKKKIIVLGSGPIRIGQGVEFDYSTVHAVKTIREMGYEAIVINNNPETVSTDYTTADKLYFEPLTVEDIMNIVDLEQPCGVIASLGGQTAVNLAEPLAKRGVRVIGTGPRAIHRAEDRDAFEMVIRELGIPHPEGVAVMSIEEGLRAAENIGYPVLVRPSYVLGGRAMEIVANETLLKQYLSSAVSVNEDSPVLVDRYIVGKEVEVDAICDGQSVFLPGIMELVERTGVHSGDSTSVYPPFSVSDRVKETIWEYTRKLGIGIGIVGLYNIQFIVDDEDNVFIIEVNPRASRSVPFLSKSTGVSLVGIATRVMLGMSLREQGFADFRLPEKEFRYVKAPAFSFEKASSARFIRLCRHPASR